MNFKPLSKIAAFAGVALFALTAFAAPKAKRTPPPKPLPWTSYQEWTFSPVIVKSDNADNEVRNQLDFTLPLHGPWLTNPSYTGMTVTWITRIKCAGGIQYREKGTSEWITKWRVKYGQIDYSKDVHYYHLSGLKPDTVYEYRLLSNVDSFNTPYSGVICTGRETYSFRTLNPKKDSYKVFLTSDIHGGLRLFLDAMLDNTGATDADLYFYLGDNVEDGPYRNIRYYITFCFLDDIVRRYGSFKPSVFLRGNHDISQNDTYYYGDYFPQPNERTYQAIVQGPALFICLDTMCQSRTKLQTEQHNAYLKEQAEWISELKKTDAWKNAKFRIVLAHFDPHSNAEYGLDFSPIQKELSPTEDNSFLGRLFGCNAYDKDRIHLYVSGHKHVYHRIDYTSRTIGIPTLTSSGMQFIRPMPDGFPLPKAFPTMSIPYPSVVIATPFIIDVTPEKITCTQCNHRLKVTEKNGFCDKFEIYPDGTVKTLAGDTMQFMPLVERDKAPKKK